MVVAAAIGAAAATLTIVSGVVQYSQTTQCAFNKQACNKQANHVNQSRWNIIQSQRSFPNHTTHVCTLHTSTHHHAR